MTKEQAQTPEGEQPKTELLTDVTFPPIGEEEQQLASEGGEPNEWAARLQAIEERFEREQQAFQEERRSWQQTVDRLIQQGTHQPAAAQPQQQQPPGVDFNDLPDPVDKPEDFKRALAEKFQKSVQTQLQSFQQQSSHQQGVSQQLDALWERFKSEHSDLADKTMTLQGAIVAERNDMQARGIDPQQGILSDQDGFMRRVAGRMRAELGTSAPEGGQQAAPQQQPANRTGGIAGGTNVNGSGKGKGKEPPGFLAQLKQSQLDSGLI